MELDILIPTYNRSAALVKNLDFLRDMLAGEKLLEKVQIIISDNGSPDNTESTVQKFSKENERLTIKYHRLPENRGIEANAVNVLSKAESEFVIWLGDDDFLPEKYLTFCFEKMEQHPNLGCILPGAINVLDDGSIFDVRPSEKDEYFCPAGFETFKKYAYLGHCMSGMFLKKEGALEEYLKFPEYRNPYIFLHLAANRMLKYDLVFAPKYKVEVEMGNEKDWKYDETGLLSELYKTLYPFVEKLGERKVVDAIIEVSKINGGRFCIEVFRPFQSTKRFRKLLRKVENLAGIKRRLTVLFLKHYAYSILHGKFQIAKFIRDNS